MPTIEKYDPGDELLRKVLEEWPDSHNEKPADYAALLSALSGGSGDEPAGEEHDQEQ